MTICVHVHARLPRYHGCGPGMTLVLVAFAESRVSSPTCIILWFIINKSFIKTFYSLVFMYPYFGGLDLFKTLQVGHIMSPEKRISVAMCFMK